MRIAARCPTKFPSSERRRRHGFTLLEVLLVVAILVGLAAVALPNLIGVQGNAKISDAKINVSNLYQGSKLFNQLHQRFPSQDEGLDALLVPVETKPPAMEAATLIDPWQVPYNYQFPGSRNQVGGPDIWSNGPDRVSGTNDDIGNWNVSRQS